MSDDLKYPFIKALTNPFSAIADRMRLFLILSLLAATLLTLNAYIFSQTFVCGISSLYASAHCNSSLAFYGVYLLVKFLILSAFLRIWYDTAFLAQKIDRTYLKKIPLRAFKFFLGLLLFLVLNTIPALSLYLLIIRKPNPIFQIELAYFTFVSIGFLVPFVMLRFYSTLAEITEGKHITDMKEILQKTRYKMSKIILSFCLLLLVIFVIFLSTMTFLRLHMGGNLMLYNFFAEISFEWVGVLITTLLLNFIRTQKEIFGS